MATTTFSAMRDLMVVAIDGLTPTSLNESVYDLHDSNSDFRAYVEEHPQSAFRRYAIVDLMEYEVPEISGQDFEERRGRFELLVGYPKTYRYGLDGARDMRDIIHEDFDQLDNAIGHRGLSIYGANSAVWDPAWGLEEGDSVTILSVNYAMYYWKAV